MSLADFFRREPKSLKGIKERSGGSPGAEGALPPLKPITGDPLSSDNRRVETRLRVE